jgi:hypothetical protein
MANNASDFNLQKLTMREFQDNLRATIEYGGNFLSVARRGTGKSVCSRKAIKDSGLREVFANLSVYERTDAGGYPDLMSGRASKYVDFLLPRLFEALIDGKDKCVLLLDEVDKADPSIWAPLLEITEDRRINGKDLPNLHAVICTANLQAEGGQRPCLPLLDRCEKYLVESSHTQWLDWASKDGNIHPSITAFIADHPEELFGDVDPGDVYADPSPRGWHKASNVLNFGEEKKWQHRVLTNKVAGFIGKKTGIKYSAYFDHYQVLLPIIEKIMKGEDIKGFKDLEQSKQCVACMISCSRLARILDEKKTKDLPKESEFVAKFLKNVDPEMALIAVRSQIGLIRMVNSGLDESKYFDEILRDMAKRIAI